MADIRWSEPEFQESWRPLEKENFISRFWSRDLALWSDQARVQKFVKNRLGWLTLTESSRAAIPSYSEFAGEIRRAGFTQVLLLAMGGSNLATAVLLEAFGRIESFPEIAILDSVDPAAVEAAEKRMNPANTLFIVSSKTGTSIETISFFKYFYEKLRALKGERAGENFAAITDAGTPLDKAAAYRGFRKIFRTPADVGGRFSFFTAFGLVPAALQGIDTGRMVALAEEVRLKEFTSASVGENSAFRLGVWLAGCVKAGRDKLTFSFAPGLSAFGGWAEQLAVESSGKDGTGLVPVLHEDLKVPEAYGKDRCFVRFSWKSDDSPERDRLAALRSAGHPVLETVLDGPEELGVEFLRWSLATVTAGRLLGVMPYDEPDVEESKKSGRRILQHFGKTGALPPSAAPLSINDPELPARLSDAASGARPGDYFALLAFLAPSETVLRLLRGAVDDLGRRHGLAATVQYGPQYLHSAGQLHKGGPNTGIFIVLTGGEERDLPVPGEKWTFGILKRAQALADFEALEAKGRRVLRIDLGNSLRGGLGTFAAIIQKICQAPVAG